MIRNFHFMNIAEEDGAIHLSLWNEPQLCCVADQPKGKGEPQLLSHPVKLSLVPK